MPVRTTPTTTDVLTRAGLLGFVAGLRSQLPLFLLSMAARRGDFAQGARRPLSSLRSGVALLSFGALALGEFVGDKLPATPSRLKPVQLVGRLVMGTVAGAAVGRDAGSSVLASGALGAIGAGAGSVAGNRFRVLLPRLSGLPDAVGAVVEDAVALGLGWLLVSKRRLFS